MIKLKVFLVLLIMTASYWLIPLSSPDNSIDLFLKQLPSLPRYVEAGYSPLGRSPIVDTLLAYPLYMPTYAEMTARLIKESHQLFPLATAVLRAGGIPLSVLHDQIKIPTLHEIPRPFLESFPPEMGSRLYGYWKAFTEIKHKTDTLLSVLTPDEKKWIKENKNLFFLNKDETDYNFFTTDSFYPFKFFELASRIDLAKLTDCSLEFSLIADDFYKYRDEFTKLTLEKDFIWEEDGLKFIISPKDHAEHHESADFFIDLGGHNTFFTNAGGTEGTRSLALHLDLKGYNTYQGKNFVQGSGFLGVGLLFSCAGNNHYQADDYSQGSGFFGVGFLVNMMGNNDFEINFGGQSFALFGSSILWNKEGGNVYLAKQGMAQAASSTLGVSFLIDAQGGNFYTNGVTGRGGSLSGGIGQGGSSGVRGYPWINRPSLYGGLSFLFIGEGMNTLKTAWLGQGSAYFLGAGILVAEGSHNVFEADYDAQGQGLHLAAGFFLSKGDHGYFKGGWGSLGVSGDRSVGMFLGIGDHNTFNGGEQSLGSSRKPKSVGIFINKGSHNSYTFQKLSSASLQYPQSPNEWSSALFLEIGQNNHFSTDVDLFKRGDGLQWGIENHSSGISMPSLNEDLISKFHSSSRASSVSTAYKPLDSNPQQAQAFINEIVTANYERRRQIYETLDLIRFKDNNFDLDLSPLLNQPTTLHEDAFNYAVQWALRNKDKVNLTAIKQALNVGSLTSEYTRKMAATLVGTFWTSQTLPVFTRIMLEDPSEEIRFIAAATLAKHLSNDSIENLQKGIASPSELVRYAIAAGLQDSPNPVALALVIPLFLDESFYVRRAAGLTAVSLGDKNGVPIVLETLKYETLDTGDNYGDNIYKKLSDYLGVDYGLDKQTWIDEWNKIKDSQHIQMKVKRESS